MASFTAIPYEDIKQFLTQNNILISNDKNQAYAQVWTMIQNNQVQLASAPIVDWIIAYNLATNQVQFNEYNASDILFTPDANLQELSTFLGLDSVNKERIIRILGYLNKLNNNTNVYDMLPDDILGEVLSKLDCKTVALACKLSRRLDNFCKSGQLANVLRKTINTTLNIENYNESQLLRLCAKQLLTVHIIGGYESLFLIKDGLVYASGTNRFGMLGLGPDTGIIAGFTLLPRLKHIREISVGSMHVLVLTYDGHVYSFGTDRGGGLGFFGVRHFPSLIPDLINIVQVSANKSSTRNYSLILANTGNVYAFGANDLGQLGLGDNVDRNEPTLVPTLNNIVQVSTGEGHSLMLANNGQVYSVGRNLYSQLGLGNMVSKNISTLIPTLYNVVQIAAGAQHSLALDRDGHVYSWGSNSAGQLGSYNVHNIPTIIPELNNIVQIAAGPNYSLALDNNGNVYGFGYNGSGELGLANLDEQYIPVLNPYLHDIIEISTAMNRSAAITSTGEIYMFGRLDLIPNAPVMVGDTPILLLNTPLQ